MKKSSKTGFLPKRPLFSYMITARLKIIVAKTGSIGNLNSRINKMSL